MKKLFVFLFAMLPAAAMADYDYDYDRPVKPESLPATARQFIRTHFPDAKITLATIDHEFLDTTYDVIFSDGMQIEFNAKGEWKEIDCRRSFVPQSVLLPPIAAFLRENFPDAKITLATIDREFLDTTYDVIFSDGMQIEFNSKGEWKEIDCRRSFVPRSVLLAPIAAFLDEHFPDARVRDIERGRHGYELSLDNRMELGFDRQGRFRGYDD
jgi:ribosomal protein S10